MKADSKSGWSSYCRRGDPEGCETARARCASDMHPLPRLSSDEVAAATGVSYRQLDYWIRTGVVGPAGRGSGSARRWLAEEVAAVRVLRSLTDLLGNRDSSGRVSVATLRCAADAFADAGHPDHGWLVVHRDRAVHVKVEKALASTIRQVGAALVVDLAVSVPVPGRTPDPPHVAGATAAPVRQKERAAATGVVTPAAAR